MLVLTLHPTHSVTYTIHTCTMRLKLSAFVTFYTPGVADKCSLGHAPPLLPTARQHRKRNVKRCRTVTLFSVRRSAVLHNRTGNGYAVPLIRVRDTRTMSNRTRRFGNNTRRGVIASDAAATAFRLRSFRPSGNENIHRRVDKNVPTFLF